MSKATKNTRPENALLTGIFDEFPTQKSKIRAQMEPSTTIYGYMRQLEFRGHKSFLTLLLSGGYSSGSMSLAPYSDPDRRIARSPPVAIWALGIGATAVAAGWQATVTVVTGI
ncbi:hypothetical protein C8J56DRAFT_891474 [Mycena floridula]|nr:hypothetical protein C8J56DRAFT_891474 [Mycena floridula]